MPSGNPLPPVKGKFSNQPPPTNGEVQEILPTPALIGENGFKNKSLSNWSFNISNGCLHGCTFCYVPSLNRYQRGFLNEFGVSDPDAQWGNYSLLRKWDEKAFLASLRIAENLKDWKAEGNRAVILCSTTDPYQVYNTSALQEARKALVENALNLILKESTINVRILTRSPLARQDFGLYKKFGNRLTFGVSIPTENDDLSKIYEPNAPGPKAKFKLLDDAKAAGLNIFIAMAPTLPDEGEEELTALMKRFMGYKPITIFHEPINLRAKNLARIEAKARELGMKVRSEVFYSRALWRRYAFERLFLVDKIARDIKLPKGVLHQWPDPSLKNEDGYVAVKQIIHEEQTGAVNLLPSQKEAAKNEFQTNIKPWIDYWQDEDSIISAWPGIRVPAWK